MTPRFRTTRVSSSRWTPRLEALESRRLFAVWTDTPFWGVPPMGPGAFPGPGEFPGPGALPGPGEIPGPGPFPGPGEFPGLGPIDLGNPSSYGDLGLLSVVQTSPASGAVLTESPTTLDVIFNQPFPTYLIGNDIRLQRVDLNGQVLEDLTSLLEPASDLPSQVSVLSSTIQGVLAPGRYQIVLLGSTSQLSGVGTVNGPGAPLANQGFDEVVSTFTITSKTPEVPPSPWETAINLGQLGSVPLVTPGSLDLSLPLGTTQYYKFTLASGHFWRLGAEVTAQRDGGTLNSVLTLYDAEGNVLKSVDVGRSDKPFDPYLFAGLQAGTYYIGVSRSPHAAVAEAPAGSLPGTPPSGTDGSTEADGTYRLHVLAQVADTRTTLLDSRLDYADPLDQRPTGITLVFSNPMDVESFRETIGPGGKVGFYGLELVDQDGRVWSLTSASFYERNSQFSFLFSSPLPKGQYTLRISTANGVTDLTGRGLVAPKNLPSGTLASWTVTADASQQDANDFGTILGYASGAVRKEGTLAAQASNSYRFVAPANGYFTIEFNASSQFFLIQVIGPDGSVIEESVLGSSLNSRTFQLTAGVYTIRTQATGSDEVKFSLALFRKQVSGESVLDNGLGQGSALNLAFLTPVPLTPTTPTNPTNPGNEPGEPTIPSPVPSPSPGPSPLPTPGSPPGLGNPGPQDPVQAPPVTGKPQGPLGTSSSAQGLVLTLGSGLIGSPTAGAEHVAAVGPGTSNGTTALAAHTPGVLQGILYGRTLGLDSANHSGESLLDSDLDDISLAWQEPSTSNPDVVAALPTGEEKVVEREIASASNWWGGIGTLLLQRLWGDATPQAPTEPEAVPVTPVAPIVMVRDDAEAPQGDEQVEHANLAAPLGFSVAAVLALRLHRPIRRWVERRRSRIAFGSHRLAPSPLGQDPTPRV